MNTFVEWLNQLAIRWSDVIWLIIWQSTVLAGGILLVSIFLRRASPAVRFWLWMLVPLRLLVMPVVSISLPLLPVVETHLEGARAGVFEAVSAIAGPTRTESAVRFPYVPY